VGALGFTARTVPPPIFTVTLMTVLDDRSVQQISEIGRVVRTISFPLLLRYQSTPQASRVAQRRAATLLDFWPWVSFPASHAVWGRSRDAPRRKVRIIPFITTHSEEITNVYSNNSNRKLL